jgi:hypothetical protein
MAVIRAVAAAAAAGIIQSRVREAELTEAQINQARDEYRGPPAVAALLWFVIADLAALDPMYQASLAAFKGMYQHSIAAAPTAPTLEARLQALVAFMTAYMHRMVCRGLFEMHKLVFTFMVAVAGQRDKREISGCEWEFLLRGSRAAAAAAAAAAGASVVRAGVGASGTKSKAVAAGSAAESQVQGGEEGLEQLVKPSWCSAAIWMGLLALERAVPDAFTGLCKAIVSSSSSSSATAEVRPGTPNDSPGWQQLLLRGSLTDFITGTGGSSSDEAAAGAGVMCLLDRLVLAVGLGQQQQQQDQQQQQPGTQFVHQRSWKSQRNKLTPFQKLLLIKVGSRLAMVQPCLHCSGLYPGTHTVFTYKHVLPSGPALCCATLMFASCS